MSFRLNHAAIHISLFCLIGGGSVGCGPKTARVTAAGSLDQYIAQAKTAPAAENKDGSLWVDHGGRANLFRDFKAREVNDVVTIRVFESTRATTTADAASAKKSSVNLGIPNFLGAENGVKELPNAVKAKSDSNFEGEGSTSRNTSISTTITARVTDVLPNGYLVVEGIKEVRLNNENQFVYLRGVLRPEDISQGNVVSSADIAQMELKVEGRGMVSQPLNPGWLYKLLTGVWPF